MLDMIELKPFLPYHIVFHIVVAYTTKYFTWNIFRMVVDEGTLTCVISLVCWKAIGQPISSLSPNLLTTFYVHLFRPCNTLFPPVCKNNYTGQELWQTQKCECVM
jgi:hypothetical protein